MSKAEDKALKAYPIKIAERDGYDENLRERKGFVKGYHQAEKDLELNWDDVSVINCLLNEVEQEFKKGMHEDKTYKGYCKEVLKRFKDYKERKEK